MRKNQSKFKDDEYIKTLIQHALSYDGVAFKNISEGYVYFSCTRHGEFKKRFDHLVNITHHVCPKCSKQI